MLKIKYNFRSLFYNYISKSNKILLIYLQRTHKSITDQKNNLKHKTCTAAKNFFFLNCINS